MKLTSHNLQDGNSLLRFVIWSTEGTGMVNVFSPGVSAEMMSTEGARAYWNKCVEKFGYKKVASDKFEC
jgi:hypothetical protein